MNLYLITSIVIFCSSLLLWNKKNEKIHLFFKLLFLLLSMQIIGENIQSPENSISILYLLTIFVCINLVGASLVKHTIFKWIIPIMSCLALYLFFNIEYQYEDYPINFGNIKIFALIIAGFSIGLGGQIMQNLLQKFFSDKEQVLLNRTTQIISAGFLILFASFSASWYGILLLTIGYYIYDCFQINKNKSLFFTLLSISIVGYFISHFGIESLDISIGKMLMGLLIGGGVFMLIYLFSKSNSKLISILFVLLSIGLLLLIAMLNQVHPAFGGNESFVIALIAMALVNAVFPMKWDENVLFSLLLTIGFLLPQEEKENQKNEEIKEQIEKSVQTFENIKSLNLAELKGKYKIDSQTALIEFQLGPKGGVTKGEIKNFEGEITFGENLENTKFEVILPTNQLTTHNSIRDASIMGDKYLNEKKHPKMKFVSNSLQTKDDGYLLNGIFTLLGKTNSQEVFIKYTEKQGDMYVIEGKSSLDRTQFGMPSSPQEGNIIDFKFIIKIKSVNENL